MKVLHVLGELRASGAEVMLHEAIQALRALDIETVVLSTGTVVGEYAAAYAADRVHVLHVPFHRGPAFAVALIRSFRREHPDVIHIHTERANAAVGMLARISGARTVRTVHSVFSYTGQFRLVRIVERAALRALGVRHFAIGRAVRENEWSRLYNPTVRIDNWIGERFSPPTDAQRAAARAAFGVPEGAYVVSSVGNCSPVKNHAAIVSALPGIADVAGRDVVYLHAGSGPDEEGERALARSHGRSVTVHFLGAVADVLPVLWASDVFCMPSLYEGVGVAALEALACGVPAVLSDVGGMRDVHPRTLSVRFQPPTVDGVILGIMELQAVQTRALREKATEVAYEVRTLRSVRTQVESLARAYRGG